MTPRSEERHGIEIAKEAHPTRAAFGVQDHWVSQQHDRVLIACTLRRLGLETVTESEETGTAGTQL